MQVTRTDSEWHLFYAAQNVRLGKLIHKLENRAHRRKVKIRKLRMLKAVNRPRSGGSLLINARGIHTDEGLLISTAEYKGLSMSNCVITRDPQPAYAIDSRDYTTPTNIFNCIFYSTPTWRVFIRSKWDTLKWKIRRLFSF